MGRLKMSGPYHLFSMQPIRSRDDLKGLRIGTTEGIEADVMHALGAQPVPLSSLEMNPALASGKIDAMHLADGSSEVFGIGKIARFRTALGFVRQCLEFGLSRALLEQAAARPEAIRFTTGCGPKPRPKRRSFTGSQEPRPVSRFAGTRHDIDLYVGHRIWTHRRCRAACSSSASLPAQKPPAGRHARC